MRDAAGDDDGRAAIGQQVAQAIFRRAGIDRRPDRSHKCCGERDGRMFGTARQAYGHDIAPADAARLEARHRPCHHLTEFAISDAPFAADKCRACWVTLEKMAGNPLQKWRADEAALVTIQPVMGQVDNIASIEGESAAIRDPGNRTLDGCENIRHHRRIDRLLRIVDIEDKIALRILRKAEIHRHLRRLRKPTRPSHLRFG
ncbi:hypothetical protein D3C72_749390 [compost metagenome]